MRLLFISDRNRIQGYPGADQIKPISVLTLVKTAGCFSIRKQADIPISAAGIQLC